MLMKENVAQVQAMIDLGMAKLKAELAEDKKAVKGIEKKTKRDTPAISGPTVSSKGGK